MIFCQRLKPDNKLNFKKLYLLYSNNKMKTRENKKFTKFQELL